MSKSHDGNARLRASSDRGVVQAITDFAAELAGHVQNRIALLVLELRAAGIHFGVLIGLALLALFSLLLGYLFLSISLMFFLALLTGWSWALVILLLAGLHLLIAAVSGLFVWLRFKRPILRATLKELEKDSEWIRNTTKSTN